MQIEWLKGWGRILSAAEVKRLPVGTEIALHKSDRHGEHAVLACTVIQYGKTKRLAYRDTWQEKQTLPIRDADNQAYTLNKKGW